jgi:hypothetical protein
MILSMLSTLSMLSMVDVVDVDTVSIVRSFHLMLLSSDSIGVDAAINRFDRRSVFVKI